MTDNERLTAPRCVRRRDVGLSLSRRQIKLILEVVVTSLEEPCTPETWKSILCK